MACSSFFSELVLFSDTDLLKNWANLEAFDCFRPSSNRGTGEGLDELGEGVNMEYEGEGVLALPEDCLLIEAPPSLSLKAPSREDPVMERGMGVVRISIPELLPLPVLCRRDISAQKLSSKMCEGDET